jgi:hypothetical protein
MRINPENENPDRECRGVDFNICRTGLPAQGVADGGDRKLLTAPLF